MRSIKLLLTYRRSGLGFLLLGASLSGLEHQVGLRLLILGGAEIFNSLENSVKRLVTCYESVFTVLDLIIGILEGILELRLYLRQLFDRYDITQIKITLLRVS